MKHLDKYRIVKFASACGPSGCSDGPPLQAKNDVLGKVRPGTGYGVMRDRAPATHAAPYQGDLPPNMTPHQFTTMSNLYRQAVHARPKKYENVPFGELDPSRQAELVNLYKRRHAPNNRAGRPGAFANR